MSGVIRGIGAVLKPLSRCQSFSASTRLPRSPRSRKTPPHDVHWLIAAYPSVRVDIADWHLGQVISSMQPTVLPRRDA